MKYRTLSNAIQSIYTEVEQYQSSDQAMHSGVCIGITAHHREDTSSLALAYSDAIRQAGGTPIIIPLSDDISVLDESLRRVDGLVLSGGTDIHPIYLDEEPHPALGSVSPLRDKYELILIRLAYSYSIPILGICRGHQMLGVAHGSTLFQDLPAQYQSEQSVNHDPKIPKTIGAHRLRNLDPYSRLSKILKLDDEDISVNSIHHQALREVYPPFYETAIAYDGVNEAIDAFPELDILSVQWHPEQLVSGGSEQQLALFRHIVHRATLYRKARLFHAQEISLDSHTDTPMFFTPEFSLAHSDKTRVDIGKMERGGIDASVMVAYLPQGEISIEGHSEAVAYARQRLEWLHQKVKACSSRAMIASSAEEIRLAKRLGKRAIVPAIENGYAIGTDLSLLGEYKEKYGIVYITLCHNGDNAICDSARKSLCSHGGLSEFGREVVSEMNRLGIMIDVSHTSEDTVRDVLELSRYPIIASHSSVRSLCDHPRNLTDEQIVAIAAKGGVVQVCLYAGFINTDETKASYLDAVNHIDYIVNLVGIEHVGIGSDFDGDGELIGCRSSEMLIRITMELFDRGYSQEEISLIWGGNFLRVMDMVQNRESR